MEANTNKASSMESMATSANDVIEKLAGQGYVASKDIATTVFLGLKMQKPILVEGPAGVGKTELAKALSKALEVELVHLQCYEGLDESKAIYEWEYAKQLLYTQMLKEKINDIVSDASTLKESIEQISAHEDAFFSKNFLLPRPLLKSITLGKPNILLIDEIDKSDPEFEAYLLEVLNSFEITIPEIGKIEATSIPLVFLTSNNSRDLSDALKRRCLHLYVDFPSNDLESQIIASRFPDLDSELIDSMVNAIHNIRMLDIKKKPSIAESLDWAKALIALQATDINHETLKETMGVILKYQADIEQVDTQIEEVLKDS